MLSIVEFFGRFHPVLVHLPIGILLIGILLQTLALYPKFGISHAVVKLVLVCGTLSALLSCLTGYLLSLTGEYDESLVTWHMWMGLGVWMVSMLLLANTIREQNDPASRVLPSGELASSRLNSSNLMSRNLVSRGLSLALLVLITVTGHLGGSLTHGSDYLTAALGGSDGPVAIIRKPIPDIREAKVYADVIQPVLQAKCYSCHGPEKQKGKLRLDDSAWMVRGGKGGAAIVISKAKRDSSLLSEGELLKRILLPAEDEHHMPPKEKPALKESEIALLQWWIGHGSDFSVKVRELPQPGRIAAYLLSLQDGNAGGGGEPKAPSLVPAAPVTAATEKDLDTLRAKRVLVTPVARGSNYLSANFINGLHITDKDLSLLLPLQKQLVWIKLGGQPIGDSGMAYIGQCKALTVLDLDHTRISDKGLASLTSLPDLRVLNLVGTKVTAKGLLVLSPLRQLQSLFLYQTEVGRQDWPALKQHFPKTVLDSGGYAVPFAPLDTTNELRPKK